jgi:hypothetical protein
MRQKQVIPSYLTGKLGSLGNEERRARRQVYRYKPIKKIQQPARTAIAIYT